MAFNRDDRRGGGDRGGGRSFGGGGRSFGGGGGYNRGGGGDRGGFRERPEMHKAVCSNCGKDCEVPFKPTGAKPVFCSDCYRNQQGGSDRRDDRGPRSFERRDAPRDDRHDDRPRESNGPDLKSQIAELNSKLDKIINLLGANSGSMSAETPNEEAAAPKKAKSPKKKAPAEEVVLAPEANIEAQVEEVVETPEEAIPTEA